MHARLLLLCIGLLTSSVACRARVATPVRSPVCAVTLPPSLSRTPSAALPASLWYGLLIKGYGGALSADPVDCAGDPVAVAVLADSCPESESPLPLRRGPVRDDELLLQRAGDDSWFAWAPLWKLGDGTAEGPLAIAERRGDQLEVRAIGSVRAYPKRARIALHRLGASYVLSVEGEHCPRPDACARGVRLTTLSRQRFAGRPLRAASTRACLSPAWFPLRERVTRRLDEHWERELTRELRLRFRPDAVTIDERIVVRDRDRAQAAQPARLFRVSQSRIRVRPTAGELLTEGQSLWRAIREQDAALDAVGP